MLEKQEVSGQPTFLSAIAAQMMDVWVPIKVMGAFIYFARQTLSGIKAEGSPDGWTAPTGPRSGGVRSRLKGSLEGWMAPSRPRSGKQRGSFSVLS